MRTILLLLILILTGSPVSSMENFVIPPQCEIIIDDFSTGIKPGWKSKAFKNETQYAWVKENGRSYVNATSSNAASGLIYEIEYDPQKYPYIIWFWKADKVIAAGDATRKSGDDYSARIYIAFPAFLFWNSRLINYIWANRLPRNHFIQSPYTSDSIMVSVESGPANTGKWLSESRNVYEDHIRFFGKKPSKVGAIAIMTDTDNTGQSTSASYGPIAICSSDPKK